MIWILTIMLVYTDIDKPLFSHYLMNTFDTKHQCWEFVLDNKVNLVDDVFKELRYASNKELKYFEFLCKDKQLKILEEV
mgnify:CR=1 FL=1|jgi:hypothetical protein